MKKRSVLLVMACSVALVALFSLVSTQAEARGENNPLPQPVVFVTSQGLYYDSTVTAEALPPVGPFQELYPCDEGLCTEFGPGDEGYVGGRWVLNPGPSAVYFSCPLLGPGRESAE